ncbi:MAG TPA: plastocyanin/azurin family copper-binding protein [Nocardioides sp.]|nr:plastocyanin/azurin family copper-binding protein [Nocardioides sp.]
MDLRVIGAGVGLLALLSSGTVPAQSAGQGSAPSGDPVARANAIVQVDNMAFQPSTVTVGLDDLVTWEFLDSMSHNTTSVQGFWSSGSRNSGTFAQEFTFSGAFAYLCTLHPSMRGLVKVPLQATGSPRAGWRLRWAMVAGDDTYDYDVQVRRPGSRKWRAFRTDTTAATGRFNPAKSGKYSVRARTARNGAHSGWSPVRRLRVS